MSIQTLALLPHSPLLIPEIGRANFAFLAKTTAAYNKIGEQLAANSISTLIIISPHVTASGDSFLLNVAPEMAMDFKDYGFIPPRTILAGDALLADQIQAALRPEFPLQLISEGILDNGSAVPAYLLRNSVPNLKLLVISPATAATLDQSFHFGEKLGATLAASDKAIAIIASGDLSHRLKKKSPGGYSPKGAKFDNKLIEYLSEPATAAANILKMDAKLVSDAGECGLKPLLVTLGALNGQAWQPQVLAYQTDFGIGYLSLNLVLNN
jgi:aromatic ring-opening dioxygenase LigB subunit